MVKHLYVIFDCKNKNFGEVLSMENDDDAKRSFILSLVNLPDVLSDDLCLYSVGSLFTCEKMSVAPSSELISYPAINEEDVDLGSRLVCTSRDVAEDVKQFRIRNAELNAIASKIHVDYSAKKFVENVEKLSRYFSKKDKRFNK